MDIQQLGDDGQMAVQHRKTVARRSDGTTALIESVGPLAWNQYGRKITFLNGRSVSLVNLIRSKSTWPRKSESQVALLKSRLTNPPENCKSQAGEELVGSDVIAGEPVSILQVAIPLPRGTSGTATCCGGEPIVAKRLTMWLAPRLGCECLQYHVEGVRPDGTSKLIVDGGPAQIVFGEPDSHWFDEGSDYTEATPSEIQTRFLEKVGVQKDD
jgi:hypothetical protein